VTHVPVDKVYRQFEFHSDHLQATAVRRNLRQLLLCHIVQYTEQNTTTRFSLTAIFFGWKPKKFRVSRFSNDFLPRAVLEQNVLSKWQRGWLRFVSAVSKLWTNDRTDSLYTVNVAILAMPFTRSTIITVCLIIDIRHRPAVCCVISKSQIPLRKLVRTWLRTSSEPAPKRFGASSEPASVMEFDF